MNVIAANFKANLNSSVPDSNSIRLAIHKDDLLQRFKKYALKLFLHSQSPIRFCANRLWAI